jgi:hypothetical protein
MLTHLVSLDRPRQRGRRRSVNCGKLFADSPELVAQEVERLALGNLKLGSQGARELGGMRPRRS